MEVFIMTLTVFALAIFVGFEIITKVPPTLHTPLMSGSNAISGITLVGALVSAGTETRLISIGSQRVARNIGRSGSLSSCFILWMR